MSISFQISLLGFMLACICFILALIHKALIDIKVEVTKIRVHYDINKDWLHIEQFYENEVNKKS